MSNTLIKRIFAKLGYKIDKINPDTTYWNGIYPTMFRFTPYECIFLKHTLFVHDRASFKLCYDELFVDEIYKFKTDTKKPYIIDCGANMGMSIIYFKTLYPNAEILAFEADPYIYGFLKKNMDSFNFTDVDVVNKAVWNNGNDSLSFMQEGGAGGRLETPQKGGEYTSVKTVRLKEYLNRKVDFLKIDIEGAEDTVLFDCADELKNAEVLFLEYHSFPSRKQRLHELLEIVQRAGFIYHIKEAFSRKHPFVDRNENVGMDFQINIFCYRK